MNTQVGLERTLSFINCHIQSPTGTASILEGNAPRCAITISRQTGCGARVVAEKLVEYLQERIPQNPRPWTIFDRNLVEHVLADHHMPERFAKFMPEDRVSEIQDVVDDILGLHPPYLTLVQQTSETILRLAELGNVIILGRGGNIITAKLPHVLHVRMMGSVEQRIKNLQEFDELGGKEAAERIRQEDLGRQRYLRKHFGKDINDPLLYHLVINTDLVPLDNTAQLIGDLALDHVATERVQDG